MKKFDEFTQAYLECALWASNDNDGKPLDGNHTIGDLSQEFIEKSIKDCKKFRKEHYGLIKNYLSQAGHDLWLTRNHHGAGFWDGGWVEWVGRFLTADVKKNYPEVILYVGDGGLIYSN